MQEWQAAYRLEINAEYLVSIGDCFAKLGNVAEARKGYEAYLGDPPEFRMKSASAAKVRLTANTL